MGKQAILNASDRREKATCPPRWRDDGHSFHKFTSHGHATIEPNPSGSGWVVYCRGFRLLKDGKPAVFTGLDEATWVADENLDGAMPGAEPLSAGYSWSTIRSGEQGAGAA
jgi:hypothetical protein